MWFEVLEIDSQDYFDVATRTGFATPLSAADSVEVYQIILECLKSKPAHYLVEGLVRLEIGSEELKLTFRYSRNEDYMRKIEEAIQRQELSSHRITFIMYVYAKVNQKFELDGSLPDGFQQTLDLSEYIG